MDSELIIKNLLPHLQTMWPVIKIIANMMGFILIMIGIGAFIGNGRHQGVNAKGPIYALASGTLLLNITSTLDLFASSVLDKESETGLGYTAPGGDDPTALYITFAVYIVMLVGFYGVVYGCILLKRSADDGRQLTSSITHLVGGTMAVNIVVFMKMLAASMGPSVESAVSKLLG
jgi:hypothetical protein